MPNVGTNVNSNEGERMSIGYKKLDAIEKYLYTALDITNII